MTSANLTAKPAATTANQTAPAGTVNEAERYLKDIASLPSAPTLLNELLGIFRAPDQDVDRVVQLISYDPALTAQILRTCSSAYYAAENPPADIFEAVSRVGFYQIYCMVVSLFGSKTKSMKGAEKGVDVDALWRHSVAVAVAASVVAEEVGLTKTVAFTAGLLHDIGKLVLAANEQETYAKLTQRAKNEGTLLSVLERGVLVVNHAEIGGELMRRWKLPVDVVAAVRYHHELEASGPYDQLTAVVQVGDMIAHQFFSEDLSQTDLLTPSIAALQKLNLGAPDLLRLIDKMRVEMEDVKSLLEM